MNASRFALHVGSALVAAVVAGGACERLEDPCTASDETLVAMVPAASGGTFAATDQRAPVVLFFSRDAALDAGTGVLGTANIPTGIIALVLDDAQRAEARRETFKPPLRLTSRKGSTPSSGAAWSPGVAVFHWVETTTTTEADGRVKSTAQLVVQSTDPAGNEGPAIEPAEMKCQDCRIDAAAIRFRGTTLIGYGITPSVPTIGAGGLGGVQPKVGVFAIGPGGEVLPRTLPPVLANQPRGLPRFDVIDGTLVLIGSVIVPVDEELRVTGPILPRFGLLATAVSLDGDPILAWSASPLAEGGAVSSEPDVLVQRFGRDGLPTTRAQRISTSVTVQAIARSGDRIGVIHRSSRQYFALASGTGEKIGGDIVASETLGNDDVRLVGHGDGSFHLLSAKDNRVVRREITCAR